MKNKKLLTGILIVVAIIVVGGFAIYRSVGPKLVLFNVEDASFTASGRKLSRVEVWAVEKTAEGKQVSVKLGDMTLQEADAQGYQTWAMEIPEQPSAEVITIAARGYGKSLRVGTIELPKSSPEDLAALVWPSRSHEGVTGTVKSITGKKFVFLMDEPVGGVLNVTVGDGATITDARGKATTIAAIRAKSKIAIIGEFTDDTEFTASAIEIVK